MPTRILAAALAALLCLPAQALLTRPDRDDPEYLELATRYASSLSLGAGGEGVLIAPRWVLTSARAAAGLAPGRSSVAFRGGIAAVQEVFFHPGATSDVALVFLAAPVPGVEPTPIYRATDEAGKGLVVVGAGPTGRIGSNALRFDGRRRGAINTVDAVEGDRLVVRIKAGDDASDLQGAMTPRETGAPAYVQAATGIFVAGILSGIEDTSRDGVIGPGDRETYVRVSAYERWIDDTMLAAAVREANAPARDGR